MSAAWPRQRGRGTDCTVLEAVFQDRKACRIGCIGDDGEPATRNRASDHRILEVIGDAIHQGAQVGERRVVSDGGEKCGSIVESRGAHIRQHRLEPPLLLATEHNEPSEEERDHQALTEHQSRLVALVGFGEAQEEEEQREEDDGVVAEDHDTGQERHVYADDPARHVELERAPVKSSADR